MRTATSQRASTEDGGSDRGAQRWALGLLCVATVMLILDVTIVNVALPPIQTALKASLSQLEWVVNAYALALAAFLLISGSLADRYGRKTFFIGGMALFTLGSLGCALATSPFALVAARGIQGVGGACLFATALAILGREFQGADRGRALGVWGAAVALGLAVGPLTGGALTELVSWRAIFFVNVPIGIATIVAAVLRLRPSAEPEGTPLDWTGSATFALALVGLVFALVEGNTLHWTSPVVLGALLVAAVSGTLFVGLERARRGLFDLTLFRNRTFDAAILAVVGQGFVIGPLLFYLVRYLQQVLGASPLVAGLEIVPMTLTCFAAAVVGGRLSSRLPGPPLLAGSLALLGLGTLLLVLVHENGSWVLLLPGLAVGGIGWGAVNPLSAHGALEAAPAERTGMASGIDNTARQVGIAIGLGALGAVFQNRLSAQATTRLAAAHVDQVQRVARAAARGGQAQALALVPPPARGAATAALSAATTSALHVVLVVGGLVALAFAAGIALLRPADEHRGS